MLPVLYKHILKHVEHYNREDNSTSIEMIKVRTCFFLLVCDTIFIFIFFYLENFATTRYLFESYPNKRRVIIIQRSCIQQQVNNKKYKHIF